MDSEKDKKIEQWLALFVVIIGTFMSILDSSIVNIAIPKMMSVFGVSLDEVKWILTSYTLALGAIIPLTGFLGDIFGNKRVYIFALSMFTLGSLLCGFAWSNTSMIIFRIIQAVGGGMIMPIGMSIIYQTFPEKDRGLALGFWGIASMAAPTIGPTLGGYIIENLDWRLIFNINVPIGIIGVVLACILLKGSPIKKINNFDYLGFISSTLGIVSILYVLGEGSTIDWSDPKNAILMTIGILFLIFFVVNELTHENSLLELRILKIFEFSLSQAISCVLTFALMGGTYVIPLFLQNIRGYTPMETGMILFPSAIAVGVMMPLSGSIFDTVGAKPVVIPGIVLLGAASYLLVGRINLDSSANSIKFILTIRGIGLGLAMMPISTAGMNAVPKQLIGKASALSNTIRQISGALSVTIMTTLIQNRFNFVYAYKSEQITLFNDMVNDKNLGTILRFILIDSNMEGMRYAIEVSIIAVVAALLMVFFMKSKKQENIVS
ncbi:DHA2 family efflux MFS transporter permease subunit [Tepidibacter aestuarii]|uniref:DHA2 family efflux MFS transporter permease subunit n=1 Tax=Tepidibacter aestuarii TaxID=2925782 RepID=UPI0020BE19D1|nr:DHA2 family efflux MFS transporter permease subunit [Tepidibacter aestuarii]CAH2213549.1 MFS transporter, DHA2 family, multidrug resistance protein [Tepidibacter aestuarii]